MAATGAEIASAYVALTVKAPGITKDIQKQLGGVDASGAGRQIGSKLASGLKTSLKVGGAAAAAVLGAALVKGFGRLKAIETAQAKMRGIGFDAKQVAGAMDNALNSVKGTAFGLGEAATTASQLMAANIKPGQELEGILKTVANNAALAGSGFDEMGSIFAKAATQANGVQNDVIGQLADKGIPIYKALGEQMGVTAGEVFKLASEGKVNFETFAKAAESAAGTAAAEMGGTTAGAFDNMMAALGRLGAKILEDVFPLIGPLFQNITTWLDAAAAKVEPIVAGIGGLFNLFKDGEFSASIREAFGWEEDSGIVRFLLGLRQTAIDVGAEVAGGARAMVAAFQAGGTDVTSSGFAGFMERVGLAARAVADFVTQHLIPGLIELGKWVIKNKDWLAALAVGLAAGALALKGYLFWNKTLVPGVKAAVGAVQAFNGALRANPIGLIITAVTALIAALVWFFTQTETGKKIWGEFTRFLGEAWANVSQFFQDTWNNVLKPFLDGFAQVFKFVWESILKPVFDGIAAVAKWVFENILQPAFLAVQLGFAVLGGIFQGIWEAVLKPVFDAIGAVFTWLWDTIISVIIAYIVIQVKVWGAIFTWLWNTILKPVFEAIGKVFQWVYQNIILPIVAGIQIAIKAAGAVFTWLWQNAVKPAIDGVASVFRWLFENIIKPVWDGISNTIKGVWERGIKPVIDTLSKVIKSDPKAAFEAARDAIGTAWAGIQELAKKPVKFVIETVINGLIGTINQIPGVNIPKVPLPNGFARGGILPGMSRMSDGDDQLIMARRGEGMMVSEALRTSADRSAFLAANAAGRRGVGFASMLQGLARGGLVNPLPLGSYSVSQPYHGGHNGIDLAAAAGTKVYAAADGVVGLAGVVPMGGNEIYVQHANGLGTRYSHLSRFATSPGTPVKAGNVIGYVGSTGMSTGPHLHYMVHNPGTGPMGYGNHVNPAPYMGLQGKDLGEAGGAQSILDGLVDFAVSKVKGAFPEGGMWIDIAAGLAKNAAETMAKVFNPFAASDGHALLYDNGGWLQPGKHLVENKSGRPEPILTASQWDSLLGSDGGSRGPVRVFIGEREFEGWMDDRADAAVDRGYEDRAAAGRFASYA